jgi:hypothetical protein
MNNQPSVAANFRSITSSVLDLSLGVPALALEITADVMSVSVSAVRGIAPTTKAVYDSTVNAGYGMANKDMSEEDLTTHIAKQRAVSYQQTLDSMVKKSATTGQKAAIGWDALMKG